MTTWNPLQPLSQFQQLWLAAAKESGGSYDVTPEKFHLIPFLSMSSRQCICRGTACIRCIGPRFTYVRAQFTPRGAPTDRLCLYPVRTPQGDRFASSVPELVGLIGQALAQGFTPLVHCSNPLLEPRFIPGYFETEPSFKGHVLLLPGGALVPPWRPQLDADTLAAELKGMEGLLTVPRVQGAELAPGPLATKVAAVRDLGFRYANRQRLHQGPGLRVWCPPTEARAYLGHTVTSLLHALRSRQHLGLPLRLFTMSFEPAPTLSMVVMWRGHNQSTVLNALSPLCAQWTPLTHQQVLLLGLAPDMQVMWARSDGKNQLEVLGHTQHV